MNTWIFLVISFSFILGLFFMPVIMIRNDEKPFLIRFSKALLITLLIGVIVGTLFFGEYKYNTETWNEGQCACGGAWDFINASDYRNNTTYYYECEECGNLFESDYHFSK